VADSVALGMVRCAVAVVACCRAFRVAQSATWTRTLASTPRDTRRRAVIASPPHFVRSVDQDGAHGATGAVRPSRYPRCASEKVRVPIRALRTLTHPHPKRLPNQRRRSMQAGCPP
jgi:hypothetical protein